MDMDGFVRICDKGDYKTAYKQHIEFEKGFNDSSVQDLLSFEEFCKELKKGYGNSDHLQIARLMETNDAIYYDNEYVA